MKKIFLVVLLTILIVGFCTLFGFFSLMPDLQSTSYTKEDLVFSKYNDTLYLKGKSEGNEKIIVLSEASNKEFELDTSSEYVYDVSSSPILYKETIDSLIIYTMRSSKVPTNFKSEVKILQLELDNPKMMKLINNKNYTNLGLKKMK